MLEPGQTIVDIGTGVGLLALEAMRRVGPSLQAVPTESSAVCLRLVEQRARDLVVAGRCTFVQCSAEQPDALPDASADRVLMRAVLAYLADKPAAIRNFYRILRPGGRISFGEPIFRDSAIMGAALTRHLDSRPAETGSALVGLTQRWLAAQFPTATADIPGNPLTNFSERDLLLMVRNANFQDIYLELHTDVRPSGPIPRETFLDIVPKPFVPTLREVMANRFDAAERAFLESTMRSVIETTGISEHNATTYLTAVKPS